MVAGADSHYTLDLVPTLQHSTTPELLILGEDDRFEKVEHAEKFVAQIPHSTLVRIPKATHPDRERSRPGSPRSHRFLHICP